MRLAALCLLAACSTPSAYKCTESSECVKSGMGGTCEPAGYCSFPDPDCPSGRRFEPNAGGGLANQCATGSATIDAPLASDASADAPRGPITFVQANAVRLNVVTSAQVAFPQALAAHDTIVLGVDGDSPGVPTISDTLGNTFTSVVGPVTSSGYSIALYVAYDVPGGADGITVTWPSPTATECHLYAHEYGGITGFDAGAGATGTTTATDGIASGFIQTHDTNELVFGYVKTGTAAAGTGFTARSTFDDNLTEDEPAATPGLYQATATMTAGSSWIVLVAAFR